MQDSQQNLRFGQPVKRFEDGRFLTGKGNYVSDIQIPHLVHAKILRALVPAGIIKSLDISEARRSKGVIDILTANDLKSENFGCLTPLISRFKADGSPNYVPPYPLLAGNRVMHLGDIIAIVIAETTIQAETADARRLSSRRFGA